MKPKVKFRMLQRADHLQSFYPDKGPIFQVRDDPGHFITLDNEKDAEFGAFVRFRGNGYVLQIGRAAA